MRSSALRIVAISVSNFFKEVKPLWATNDILVEKTGLQSSQVKRALAELTRLGWLSRYRAGRGSKYIYKLTFPKSGPMMAPPLRPGRGVEGSNSLHVRHLRESGSTMGPVPESGPVENKSGPMETGSGHTVGPASSSKTRKTKRARARKVGDASRTLFQNGRLPPELGVDRNPRSGGLKRIEVEVLLARAGESRGVCIDCGRDVDPDVSCCGGCTAARLGWT